MASLLETLMKRMGCGDREDIAAEAKELLRQAEANQNVGHMYYVVSFWGTSLHYHQKKALKSIMSSV